MLNNPTLETLRALKLHGMAAAFEEQLQNPSSASLAFEERFGLLVDRERLHREDGRTTRLLRHARLKHSQASVEDINYRADRKLDKRLIATLATGEWIRRGHGLLMTGKTGTGKSWLFCALARQACRQGLVGAVLASREAPRAAADRARRWQLHRTAQEDRQDRRDRAGRLGTDSHHRPGPRSCA